MFSRLFALFFICAGTGNALADRPPIHEQLQIPTCLADKIPFAHTVLAENTKFKVIDILSSEVDNITLLADSLSCGRFINLSRSFQGGNNPKKRAVSLLQKKPTRPRSAVAYSLSHGPEVSLALSQLEPDTIWDTLSHLTNFYNRSATKKTGVEAANWLKSRFDAMAALYGRSDTASYFVDTGWYMQPSVVTVIGQGIDKPAIVLGAHMDTLDGLMPGAGDNGSGSASLMEAARVLLASRLTMQRPVYIIWYAAEERGLVGSQYVVEHFLEKNIRVKAAMQLDMTGYRVDPADPTMWIYTDYTDQDLNGFVQQIMQTYLGVPVKFSQCGYGCSDHVSWNQVGVPAVFPCESNFPDHNPYIHTASDTMSILNLEHMTNFAKLAIAFSLELGLTAEDASLANTKTTKNLT